MFKLIIQNNKNKLVLVVYFNIPINIASDTILSWVINRTIGRVINSIVMAIKLLIKLTNQIMFWVSLNNTFSIEREDNYKLLNKLSR